MKNLLISCVFLSLLSCNNNAKENSPKETIANSQQNINLQSERDSLLSLFNDVTSDILEIRQIEHIVSITKNNGDEMNLSQNINVELAAIKATLQERRERLEELERKLQSQAGEATKLREMISNLVQQINSNEATINELSNKLALANATIADLNITVDSLNLTVSNERSQREQVQQQNIDLTNEINRCFYALGSSKELKAHKIIEAGFLKKTKIMQGDYELSYFTQADRRTLTSIPLHSKKIKVKTNHPVNSYNIEEDSNGIKTMVITNPAAFWQNSNFLVIQID